MANEREIKSRKRKVKSQNAMKDKRDAKSSLIGKVNAEEKKKTSTTKSSLANKVNDLEVKKVETPKKKDDNKKADTKNKDVKPEKTSQGLKKNKKEKKAKTGKFANSFFFKLSKIGQFTLVLMVVCFIFLGFLGVRSLMNKGQVVLGSREEPVIVISDEEVNSVKEAVEKAVPDADSISVDYTAYRLIIVADLADSTTAKDGKSVNNKIYKAVNGVLPIKEYFYSDEKLNNDLYIYSSDVVPTDYETNSKYIYQTYQNSRMKKANSYNLLTPRDKESAKEVLETMDKAGN